MLDMTHCFRAGLSLACAATLGCAQGDATPAFSGPPMAIAVAPLSLEGIAYACYDLRVDNDLEETVWSLGTAAAEGAAPAVCSSQYGNAAGGDVTYIGTCDATDADPDDGGVAMNRVTLWVDGLYDAGGVDLGDWRNPCPWPAGCAVSVPCVANADQRVDFDLTIMRAARQGFFDIGVDFDDVFCSGKLDCADPETGAPLRLTFDPVTRRQVPTAVVAFACSGGVAEDTHLYFSHLTITCADTAPVVIDLSADDGNLFSATALAPDPLAQVTLFRDVEGLTDSITGESLAKVFQTVALGFDLLGTGKSCSLSLTATASAGPLDACATEAQATYPVVTWALPITNPTGTGFVCDQHPLDGTALTEVFTSYTPIGQPATFTTEVFGTGTSAAARSCGGGGGGGGGQGAIEGLVYFDGTADGIDELYAGLPIFSDGLTETCMIEGNEVPCLDWFGYQASEDLLWYEQGDYLGAGWNPVVRLVGSGGTVRELTLPTTSATFRFDGLPTGESYCVSWVNAAPPGYFSAGFRWPVEPRIALPVSGHSADWPDGDPVEQCGLAVTTGGTTRQDFGLAYSDGGFMIISDIGFLSGVFYWEGSSVEYPGATAAWPASDLARNQPGYQPMADLSETPPGDPGINACPVTGGHDCDHALGADPSFLPAPALQDVLVRVHEDAGGFSGALVDEMAFTVTPAGTSYDFDLDVGTYCVSWVNPPPMCADYPSYNPEGLPANYLWSCELGGVTLYPAEPYQSNAWGYGDVVTICGVVIEDGVETRQDFGIFFVD